jgi:leader peptidase (prepilin peptidase)/N-methyltransferase
MSVTALAQKYALNIVTAALGVVAVARLGTSAELPAVLVFIFGGVLLAAIDWKVHRLPTRIIYLTLAGVLVGLVLASIVERAWVPLATAVAGGALFANAFFAIYVFARQLVGVMVLGLGDVRLAALIGLVLGWYGLPYVLYGALVGHALVAVVAIVTCLRRRQLTLRYSFGPPLLAGALAVVLFHG